MRAVVLKKGPIRPLDSTPPDRRAVKVGVVGPFAWRPGLCSGESASEGTGGARCLEVQNGSNAQYDYSDSAPFGGHSPTVADAWRIRPRRPVRGARRNAACAAPVPGRAGRGHGPLRRRLKRRVTHFGNRPRGAGEAGG